MLPEKEFVNKRWNGTFQRQTSQLLLLPPRDSGVSFPQLCLLQSHLDVENSLASVWCFMITVEGWIGLVVKLVHAWPGSAQKAGIPAMLNGIWWKQKEQCALEQIFNLERRELPSDNIFPVNVVTSFKKQNQWIPDSQEADRICLHNSDLSDTKSESLISVFTSIQFTYIFKGQNEKNDEWMKSYWADVFLKISACYY